MNDSTVQVTKRCSKCWRHLPIGPASFCRNRSQPDGWSHTCKACRKAPPRPRGMLTDAEFAHRFWCRVDKSGPLPPHRPELGPCWQWTGSIGVTTGYGRVHRSYPRRELLAHRVSWELAHGTSAGGLFVCHHCDNRRCVRPDHLFLGTASENFLDMHAKGRSNPTRGSAAYQAKLTEADVLVIRRESAAGSSDIELARRFGVCPSNIWQIKARRAWRHVP